MKAYWDLKISAAKQDEAFQVLERFENATSLVARDPHFNEYYKFPDTYECRFSTDGFSDDPQAAISELRQVCEKIGQPWHEFGSICDDAQLEYSLIIDCRSSQVYLAGVSWAHCQVVPNAFDEGDHEKS